MKFLKLSALFVVLCSLCGLVGCMSMEEMLASQDPEIHGWGEDWAVDVVSDRYSQTPLEKKLEVLKQIKDQERLAKVYVGKRTAPEVKAEVANRITEEKAFLYIMSHAQTEDDVKMAAAGIKQKQAAGKAKGEKKSKIALKADPKQKEAKGKAVASARSGKAATKVEKLYGPSNEKIGEYYKNACGKSDVSAEQKNFIESCTRDGVMLGMPFDAVVETLGNECSPHEKWEQQRVDGGRTLIPPSSFKGRFRVVYTKHPSGHTALQIYGKDGVVVGLSSVPKDMAPTYKYELASGERKVWCCGDMIAVTSRKAVWPTGGVHNFHDVDKRLPSSFFAIEGVRLGMTERETHFVLDFVWDFREDTKNSYAKLPPYAQTEVGKLFPNLTVDWSDWAQSWYGPDTKPVAIEHYFGVAYEITRRYSKSESKSVGGYEGLKQRLCQKLGTVPTKTSPKISLAALDRPYSKGSKFDKRFDPWMIWQIPEKDLLVELREIHNYADVDKEHETRCDLIISSISLLKAKEEGNKAAQTSASAGF